VIFDWDENKEKENIRKHQVTFAEAAKAFSDENAVDILDELNSDYEIRYQIIALSPFRLLFVAYTIRQQESEDVYRIISARRANAKQARYYNEYNR
jgi:uncharacterized protein